MLEGILKRFRRNGTMGQENFKNIGEKVKDDNSWFEQGANGSHDEYLEPSTNPKLSTPYVTPLEEAVKSAAQVIQVQTREYKEIDWEETERQLNDEITNLGNSEDQKSSAYHGELKDIPVLVEEFNVIQRELVEYGRENLEDRSVFDKYKDVVSRQVGVLEQIKQHTANYVLELNGLEGKTFDGLGKKNDEVIGEANEYNRQLKHYDSICGLIDDLVQDSERSKGLIEQQTKGHKIQQYQRTEIQLYGRLEEADERINFLRQSYKSESDRNRVLNIAINVGRGTINRINNIQRTLYDSLATQESAIAIHYMFDSVKDINLDDVINSGAAFVEHYQRAVEKLEDTTRVDPVAVYAKLDDVSKVIGEIDKRYHARRDIQTKQAEEIVTGYARDRNKLTAK